MWFPPGVKCWSPPATFSKVLSGSRLVAAVQAHRISRSANRRNEQHLVIYAQEPRGPGREPHVPHLYSLISEKQSRRCVLGQVAAAALTAVVPEVLASEQMESIAPERFSSSFGRPAAGTKRVLMCRHGQTEYNRLNLMQGRRVDAPINDNGMQQAELLGRAVADQELRLVASSSLLRAKQTADAVQRLQNRPGAERLALPELDEIDFGEVDGMDVTRARATMGAVYVQWMAGGKDARAPGGESFREIEERCRGGVRRLLAECEEGGAVLAVTHSALIRCYLAVSLDMPYAKAKGLAQPNCCINALDFAPGGSVQAVALGDTRHLPPTLVTHAPFPGVPWAACGADGRECLAASAERAAWRALS